MGFRRYVAPTAREALERIRKELGADAVILSNRRTGPARVEIIAAAQGQMDALVDDFVPAAAPAKAPQANAPVRKPAAPANAAAPARRTPPETFQEFIRRQSSEPGARSEGVALYHQVARDSEEAPPSRARPALAVPRSAAAPVPRAPAMPAAAFDAQAEEFGETPEPAVFRRRPSRTPQWSDAPQDDADDALQDRYPQPPPAARPAARAPAPARPFAQPEAAERTRPPVQPAERARPSVADMVPQMVEQMLPPMVQQMIQKMVDQKVQQMAPQVLAPPPATPTAMQPVLALEPAAAQVPPAPPAVAQPAMAAVPAAVVPEAVAAVPVAANVMPAAPATAIATAPAVDAAPASVPVPAAALAPAPAPTPAPTPAPASAAIAPALPAMAIAQPPVPTAAPIEPMFAQGAATVAPLPDSRLMAELHSLRSALTDRISLLEVRLSRAEPQVLAQASVVEPIRAPAPAPAVAAPAPAAPAVPAQGAVRRQVMTRLIMSGFSPQLSRRVGDAAPASLDAKGTDAWLQQVIGQYVRCPADIDNPLLVPGALALVGPTGVGKTTTIAKIAARFVVRHGAGALGLVTLDSYRMGAHEQLRGYGRILGVPVHTAHDAASLRELLASLQGRRQVLIDTCGMSQRDPRLGEMLAMLDEVRFGDKPVKRVLLINAASHAETLDEVARGWRVESVNGAILTKIDEAARIGGALDALMRFQTPLLGLTNGQRVPEDWHPGNPPLLAHIALKPFGAAFSLDSDELQAITRTGALIG